jgi:plasmid stabilization system protein ParE
MTYQVKTSRRAERDARSAYHYIADQAPEAAQRWYRGLRQAIDSLAVFPLRCSVAPEDPHFPEEIRHLLYGRRRGTYRILFTIRENRRCPRHSP